MSILDEIVAAKRDEIEELKREPISTLQQKAAEFQTTRERRPFCTLFEKSVLIAEIKPKSPSAGELTESPLEVAELYAKSDADAISVLTDQQYFGGDVELLAKVRSRVPQAIFRKDFIVDPHQVYETLLAGADAFLLIAVILSESELWDLITLGNELGLDTLVEVHDETDLDKTLAAGAELIGINNRNLKTLGIDLATTERLMKLVPQHIPAVSESGISTVADVERVRAAGVRGILVGTSILQSNDPLAKIAELKQALGNMDVGHP